MGGSRDGLPVPPGIPTAFVREKYMYTSITIKTKLIALLGKPLGFTKAPTMLNGAFGEAGLDYFYFPVEATAETLPDILPAVRRMNFAGLVVTKPLKIEMLRYLDAIDPLAEKTGSINTVVIKEGKFIGHNTDGLGFTRALVDKFGKEAEGKTFFILGAGGASRAVCFSLAENCRAKRFVITDVVAEAGKSLADDLAAKSGVEAVFLAPGDARIPGEIARSDFIVNASGIGMEPHLDETPIPPEWLRPELVVCDLAYNPPKTRLLALAEKAGCRTMNGAGMVVMQGAMQFSLWTGEPEPIDTMREIINKVLGL